MAGCQKSFLLWSYWYTASNEIIMSRNVSKARGIIPLNSSTDAPRRMRTRGRTGWEAAGGKRQPPRLSLPFSVAFLKGYMQGHVTFRGLNKKKLFYCNSAFLFILLVWAFKAVLVAMRLAQHIRVSHFLLISKCTFVVCKQPMATLVLIRRTSPALARRRHGQSPRRPRGVWRNSPPPLLGLVLFVLFRKRGE